MLNKRRIVICPKTEHGTALSSAVNAISSTRVPPPLPLCAGILLRPSGFIEPCLPSTADQPPSGPDWVHEIKHDGYRVRLATLTGID
jgi:ATP-dependent DNA ligase